jgi:hypothetical protein
MNSQSHTSMSHALAGHAHVMLQPMREDPSEVIRAATCQQSHLLSSRHSMESTHAEQLSAFLAPRAGRPGAAAGASVGSSTRSVAVVALAGVLALGVAGGLLLMPHAQPAVQAAPFVQVFDLPQ